MRMRMHSKSGIVNGLFPDRNRLVVIKVYPQDGLLGLLPGKQLVVSRLG